MVDGQSSREKVHCFLCYASELCAAKDSHIYDYIYLLILSGVNDTLAVLIYAKLRQDSGVRYVMHCTH